MHTVPVALLKIVRVSLTTTLWGSVVPPLCRREHLAQRGPKPWQLRRASLWWSPRSVCLQTRVLSTAPQDLRQAPHPGVPSNAGGGWTASVGAGTAFTGLTLGLNLLNKKWKLACKIYDLDSIQVWSVNDFIVGGWWQKAVHAIEPPDSLGASHWSVRV